MSSNGVSSSNVPAALADGQLLFGRINRRCIKKSTKRIINQIFLKMQEKILFLSGGFLTEHFF
jgi:hypothetical protein